jgi:methylated-DNA-protein-cysteine methyltransferase-like protein
MKTCSRGHKYSGSGPCPICWPGHYAKKQSFSDKVVEAAKSVPKGRVTTYGRLARAAGAGPMASQSITSILGKASDAGVKGIPFHRIVYADGRVWVDAQHKAERLKLYKKEGIKVGKDGRIENFGDIVFDF